MASISKHQKASGEVRYDVRYRAGGPAIEEAFRRRQDAQNRVRQIEAEKSLARSSIRGEAARGSESSPSAGSRRGR